MNYEYLILVKDNFDALKKNKVLTINTKIGNNMVSIYLRQKLESNRISADIFVNESPIFYNLFPVLNEGFVHTRVICKDFDGDFIFIANDENDSNLDITIDNIDKMTLYYTI